VLAQQPHPTDELVEAAVDPADVVAVPVPVGHLSAHNSSVERSTVQLTSGCVVNSLSGL
jgi:hypothetical protein